MPDGCWKADLSDTLIKNYNLDSSEIYTPETPVIWMTHKNMRMSKGLQRIDKYMKRFCACHKKKFWHLLKGRVDLNGLGELLIRTKQKYLWIQLDQNKFAKNFGSICNNNRCKGEAKNIANYFISIVLIFKLQWQQGEAEIESD